MKSNTANALTAISLLLIAFTWYSADNRFRTQPIQSPSSYVLDKQSFVAFGSPAIGRLISDNAIELENTTSKRVGAVVEIQADNSSHRLLRFKADLNNLAQDRTYTLENSKAVLTFLRFMQGDTHLKFAAVNRAPKRVIHRTLDALVLMPETADKTILGMHASTSGKWSLTSIQLSQVQFTEHYKFARVLLLVLWLGLLVYLIACMVKEKLILSGIPVLVGIAVIIVLTAASRTAVRSIFIPILDKASSFIPSANVQNLNTILGTGHAVMFAILAFILFVLHKRFSITLVHSVGLCVFLAGTSEAIQRHSLTRTPQLNDLGLDILGVTAALVIYLGLRLLKSRYYRSKVGR